MKAETRKVLDLLQDALGQMTEAIDILRTEVTEATTLNEEANALNEQRQGQDNVGP